MVGSFVQAHTKYRVGQMKTRWLKVKRHSHAWMVRCHERCRNAGIHATDGRIWKKRRPGHRSMSHEVCEGSHRFPSYQNLYMIVAMSPVRNRKNLAIKQHIFLFIITNSSSEIQMIWQHKNSHFSFNSRRCNIYAKAALLECKSNINGDKLFSNVCFYMDNNYWQCHTHRSQSLLLLLKMTIIGKYIHFSYLKVVAVIYLRKLHIRIFMNNYNIASRM